MAAQGASLGSVIPGVGTVAGGLGGFALGGLRNLFGRRAASAPMDLSVQDAADAITRAYQTYLGRTPSPEEVWSRIAGTGWQPGQRWVGESGLRYHLQDIASSEEARRRRGLLADIASSEEAWRRWGLLSDIASSEEAWRRWGM